MSLKHCSRDVDVTFQELVQNMHMILESRLIRFQTKVPTKNPTDNERKLISIYRLQQAPVPGLVQKHAMKVVLDAFNILRERGIQI